MGFDDIFAAELCTPSLTTLGGAHAEVGRAAVEILLQANGPARDGADPPQVALPTELMLRSSTADARETPAT